MELGRDAAKLAHRLVIALGRHGHEVRRAADVDTRSIRVGDRQGLPGLARFRAEAAIALRQEMLHYPLPPRTTLTRGQLRTTATSVFRRAALHLATTPAHTEFLRRDLRQQADYFANPAFEQRAASALRLLAVPSSLRSSAAAQRHRFA